MLNPEDVSANGHKQVRMRLYQQQQQQKERKKWETTSMDDRSFKYFRSAMAGSTWSTMRNNTEPLPPLSPQPIHWK